jgi:hypothetical protein
MPDGALLNLALRQADQARADFYEIKTDLEMIMERISRLPSRRELAEVALLAMSAGAGSGDLRPIPDWPLNRAARENV